MALRRVPRRRRASITSLIDVIFLLLLFFMLASTFENFSEVEIAASRSDGAAIVNDRTVYRVEIGETQIALDGGPVSDADLNARLETRLATEPGLVLVSVTPEASTQRLVDVISRLNGLSGATIRVVSES